MIFTVYGQFEVLVNRCYIIIYVLNVYTRGYIVHLPGVSLEVDIRGRTVLKCKIHSCWWLYANKRIIDDINLGVGVCAMREMEPRSLQGFSFLNKTIYDKYTCETCFSIIMNAHLGFRSFYNLLSYITLKIRTFYHYHRLCCGCVIKIIFLIYVWATDW